MAGIREVFEIVDRATAPLRKITEQMSKTSASAGALQKMVLQAVGAFATFKTVQAAVQLSDQLTQVQARINGITGDLGGDRAGAEHDLSGRAAVPRILSGDDGHRGGPEVPDGRHL